MNISIYIIINFLVFGSWHIFLFRFRSLTLFSERLAGSFVLGIAQITLSSLILGAGFKELYPRPLLLFNLVISLVLLACTLYSIYKDGQNGLTGFAGALIAEIRSAVSWLYGEFKSDIILTVISISCFAGILWIVFLGYLLPSYTWDGLWYHLPIVGYIMQSGAVQEIPNDTFIHQFINIFPKNIELFFLWNVIFLKSDRIVDLSQVPFVFLGMISVYSLAVKTGAGKRHAMYSALLFFFTPIMILQASTNYVDVAISSLFVTAVNFLSGSALPDDRFDFSAVRKRRTINLVLAGFAAGVLLGAKGSGPLFIVILTVSIIVQKLRSHLSREDRKLIYARKDLSRYVLCFAAPAILMGGYWYIKNWIVYSNPVYPMEIAILGKTIFKGLYKGIIEPAPDIIKKLSFLESPLYVWLENIRYYLYDSRLGGLGPLWFILLLPSAVFFTIISAVRRNFRGLGLSAVFIAAFLLYPRNWTPRYVIFIVAFGAVSFGWLLSYLGIYSRIIRTAAMILALYTLLISNSPAVTPAQISRFVSLPPSERTIARLKPFNIDMQARQEYGHWIWISENVSAGDTLAYTFDPLFLAPLWNSSFSSRITYIKPRDRNDLIAELKRQDVRYLLVRSNSREDNWISKEMKVRSSLGWLGGAKRKFSVRYQDENYKIIERIK